MVRSLDVRGLSMKAVKCEEPVEVILPVQTWLVATNVTVRMGMSQLMEMTMILILWRLGVLVRMFPPLFLIVCFTSCFMFSKAVLPLSPEVVYFHLLLRRETRIPWLPPPLFE